MKKNGFTLIELLAVIIILAVIALIATPIVLRVVDQAKDGANRSSTYGIIDAAKLFYIETQLDEDNAIKIDGNTNILDYLTLEGKNPDSGEVKVNNKGKVAISVEFDNKCYSKEYGETNLTVTKTEGTGCKIPNQDDNVGQPTLTGKIKTIKKTDEFVEMKQLIVIIVGKTKESSEDNVFLATRAFTDEEGNDYLGNIIVEESAGQGIYSVNLDPGTYTMIIEKGGYLTRVITDILIEEDSFVEAKDIRILAGKVTYLYESPSVLFKNIGGGFVGIDTYGESIQIGDMSVINFCADTRSDLNEDGVKCDDDDKSYVTANFTKWKTTTSGLPLVDE